MHDLLEGALQYEVKLMLQRMIYNERYFTLSFLNTRLENLELGYMESKNRPTLLLEKNVRAPTGLSLKQNGKSGNIHKHVCKHYMNLCTCLLLASQMWLLARVLPLLVGDQIPDDDESWDNFLRMMEIVDRLFCPQLTEDDAVYIKWLIADHHKDFVTLYPDKSIIPKMHFMIHMPRLIIG